MKNKHIKAFEKFTERDYKCDDLYIFIGKIRLPDLVKVFNNLPSYHIMGDGDVYKESLDNMVVKTVRVSIYNILDVYVKKGEEFLFAGESESYLIR